MSIRDYIGQKLSPYGQLSGADILEFSMASDLSPDEEMCKEILPEVEEGMARLMPSLLLRPDSVNENGFSVSWDKDGLLQYYLSLCRRNSITPEVVSGVGTVSSYMDY